MLKMYFLVLYNLSPIQQGIQAGHCAVEYILKEKESIVAAMASAWAEDDKTFIILNGGTSITMESHKNFLDRNKIFYATFQEPDFGNLMTCICFIANDGDEITRYFTPLFKLA